MRGLLARLFVALALLAPAAAGAQTITPTYGWITLTPRSVVPSPLANGNCWTQSTGLFCRINGATVGPYIAAGGASLVVGSTVITSGTTGRLLYDNGGLLGELATTGSGSVVLGTSPTIATPTVTGSFTATGLVTNADLANAATTVNGQSCVLGATCTVSAAASSLTIGTTTISGGTAPCALENSTGTTLACLAISASGATASTLAERDANANLSANNYFASGTKTSAGGAPVVLTAASTQAQIITGSGSQTFTLPDATTLPLGPVFLFNNNSSGTTTINNAGSSLVYSLPAGGEVTVGLTDNGSTNGTWDAHPRPPATVQWGSGTTGLVMNSALSTTPQINAGASSSTVPALLPQRASSTTGFGGDSTHLYGIVAGAAVLTQAAGGSTFGSPTGGAEGAGTLNAAGLFVNGVAAITSVPHDKQVVWCGTCTVAADTLPAWVPQTAGTITSITYLTGAGSFTADVTIAGSSMSTCNAVSVSSSTPTTTSCTGTHTFSSNQQINVVTSAISGSPVDALVQINYTIP